MRDLHSYEKPLILFLLERANLALSLDDIKAIPLNDGGMGSLQFCSSHTQNRRLGKTPSECTFRDKDNTEVLAFLNLDQNGQLFELDIFKVDFSPLLQWPTQQELQDANPL